MASEQETVTTWANGFGKWHARVNFPAPGYDQDTVRANTKRIRAKARRAMRREMEQRETVSPEWRLRTEYISDVMRDDRIQSVTYAEVITEHDESEYKPV